MNCLRPGHFIKQCRSLNRCRKCQRAHHTLLHLEAKEGLPTPPAHLEALINASFITTCPSEALTKPIVSNAAAGLTTNSLLMNCRVLICAPDGSSVEARVILDSASSVSFVSQRLAQVLCLPRSHRNANISGVAGLSQDSLQTIADFEVSAVQLPSKKFQVTAVVIPRVTCDLPLRTVHFNAEWKHLFGLRLADPDFGRPGRIDILLGVDVFVQALLHGRRV